MNKQIIITYSLSGKKNALDLTRKIYGYTDASNYGKYKYQRNGLLTGIPYEKLARGCLLVDPKHENQVAQALTSLGLKIKILTIDILNKR